MPPVTPPHPEPPPARLRSAEGLRYSGRVFGVLHKSVYGWVRNDRRPDEIFEVEAISNGHVFRTVRVDGDVPMALPVPADLRGHGFVLPVFDNWRDRLLKRHEKHAVLRIRNTDIVIGEVSVRRNDRDLEGAGFNGYCDTVDSHLHGWVWRPGDPDAAVDISVFVDGGFLTRTTASEPRDDVRAAGFGSGAYGFNVPLPEPLRDGTPRQIEIVVAEAGVFLKRGRLMLFGDTSQPFE
jgi:hypothetical protein